MELKNPIVIFICIMIFLIMIFLKKKKSNYTDGKKVANTQFIKDTEYYKKKIKKYTIISNTIKILYVITAIICGILISRPIKFQTNETEYNRDIFLTIDLSKSEVEVNYELVKRFKEMIPNIKGDRIGIVIFNTNPVVLCPLTDDYDFIIDNLNTLEEQLENARNKNISTNDDPGQALFYGGITTNSDERGSSLVGDGLAGTVYSFPDIKTNSDRTRIIVFATDNCVEGQEIVTLDEACELCKQYNINLYAYGPSQDINSYVTKAKIQSYQTAVEQKAGGKFYTGDLTNMINKIVDEIKDTKKSLLESSKKTVIRDYPETYFIFLTVLIIALFICQKIIAF